MNHTLSDSQLEAMIKSAVNSSGPLPPDEKFSQLVSALRELQERRKAAIDSEPVRNPVLAYADSYRDMAKQGVESVPIWSVITDLERNIAPLYIHAQQPVVSDESYQQLSELYHAQEKRLFKIAQRIKGPAFDKYSHSPSQAIDVLEGAIFGEDDACRAAMLQAGNCRENANSSTNNFRKISETSTNSLVTPGWIPVSERMPEGSEEVLCAKEFDGPGDWRKKVGYLLAGKWTVYGASWAPTHWMPLPNSPQEAK